MGWNFNLDEAPRGRTKEVAGPKDTTRTVHVPDLIVAAGKCGVVTVSKWLPDQGRWNMFTKDSPPIAWMPWPDAPADPT